MLSRFANIDQFKFFICLDTEFTCWANSYELEWPDPKFPPEVIQIGLSVYEVPEFTLSDEFASYVLPRVNSTLSEYCKNLLNLTQGVIDTAKIFSVIVGDIAVFLNSYPPSRALVCSFGADWEKINADAFRHSVDDPFAQFEKLDLRIEASRILGYTGQSIVREWIYRKFGLPDCAKRHDALCDARDLVRIVDALNTYQGSCQTDILNGIQTH